MVRFLAAALIVGVVAPPLFAQPANENDVAWIKQHAVPLKTSVAENGFEDLQPLKEIIGDARIVSLGESTHGSREIFQMKHRLVEFLASEMGFTIFSIEANMPESYRLNDYVHSGEGDVNQLIAGMYFWTWNTEEVKDMVEWMRRFNQSGKRLDFTGFDMQTPDVAAGEVLDFLDKADKELHATAKAAYANVLKQRDVVAPEFGVATGSFPVEAARGKKIRFSGWIKTDSVDAYAGLWWRADGPGNKLLAFDNMQSQKIKGTRDWQEYSIELTIPLETQNINFGVLMPGTGKAWFDGLGITVDEQPFRSPEAFDLDFEAAEIKGLFNPRLRSYRTTLDSKIAKVGKQSLRLESVPRPKQAIAPEDFKRYVAACAEIHSKLTQARDQLIEKFTAKEVDWAIQNARVALTAVQQRGGNMLVRDSAMAENVAWILEQNPDAKIVLWAHNYHVSKQPLAMGKYLDEKFGKQHLAIGFATSRGEYQAIGQGGLGKHKLQSPPEDSYEAAFQRTDVPRFYLDLRSTSNSKEAAWLTQPHQFRGIGAMAMETQFNTVPLVTLFDGIIYIDETSAAKPLR